MGLKDIISTVGAFFNETKKIKKEGREMVSYKNTYAAFNLIVLKTENRIFIFSTIASLIFLVVYGYQIYLNALNSSIRHIVIYSILGVILISSLIFNIVLNPMRKNKMSTNEKNRANKIKNTEKNIELVISTLTKLVSLGYMLFEIITIDASMKRIIPFASSGIALIIQLLVTYISKLLINYYNILLIGIDKDIKDSGLIDILSNTNIIDGPIKVAENVKKSSASKIFGKIQNQIETNELVKEKNEKDLLYKITNFLLENDKTVDDVKEEFGYSIKKTLELLNVLENLDIIYISKSKVIEMLTFDPYEIKDKIYNN